MVRNDYVETKLMSFADGEHSIIGASVNENYPNANLYYFLVDHLNNPERSGKITGLMAELFAEDSVPGFLVDEWPCASVANVDTVVKNCPFLGEVIWKRKLTEKV